MRIARSLLLLAIFIAVLPHGGATSGSSDVALAAVPGRSVGAQASDTLDAARRAYIASRVYSAVQLYFAHWDDVPPEFDLDATYRAYLDEALAASDRRAFSLATMAFMARLNNAHTAFRDNELYAAAGKRHRFSVRYLDGDWTVTSSERSDLKAGDVLVELDDMPIEDFYLASKPYISASTDHHARRLLWDSGRRYLFPLNYTLTLSDGRRVDVDRQGEAGRAATRVTEGRWLEDGRTAYIRVPSWNGSQFQERALELLEEYREARALVIDVRGNGGGSTPVTFINALMEREWRWWAESTPLHFALFRYYADRGRSGFGDFERPHIAWPATSQPADSAFLGRIAILVDAGCYSACEDFSMPFKDNGRALLVGEATAGSTGQPYYEDLDDGMRFGVGAKREFFPGGGRFEGVGVSPDIQILPTKEDLRAGRDAELERALEVLAEG